jgi:hypothetical protein
LKLNSFSKEVRISVKSSNDKKPTTQCIPIAIVNKKLVKNGEIVTLAEEKAVYKPENYTKLLPKKIEEGPTITPEPLGQLGPVKSNNTKSFLEASFTVIHCSCISHISGAFGARSKMLQWSFDSISQSQFCLGKQNSRGDCY